ncbi:MAG: dTDP-4-dehydrorhamnose reductase [Bdellovibrionia bacterium]
MRKILVLGVQGQLGRALREVLKGTLTVFASRAEVDLVDPCAVERFLQAERPNVLINAAAYTAVDQAESDREAAHLVNALSPGVMAEWCVRNQAQFVHFSTDYVFSGDGITPWRESDPTSPLNVYGQTKAQGEVLIEHAGGQYLIFRTSWVYDLSGKNFLRTIIRLAKERESLQVVDDQIGAPTYAMDLAQGAWDALCLAQGRNSFPSGIYHLCNQGETSWYGFAQAIFSELADSGVVLQVKQVNPVVSSLYPTLAKRPKNSRLSQAKVFQTFGLTLPHWKVSLQNAIRSGIQEFK